MVTVHAGERDQAQFRRYVSSQGLGRSAVRVAKHVFCAQAHAAHVALGGEAMPTGGRKLKALLQVAVGHGASETVPEQKSRHPGSAFIRFLNGKGKTFKRLHNPKGPNHALENQR